MLHRWSGAATFGVALLVAGGPGGAAGGSAIRNSASVSYELGAGRIFTVTSNTVQIVVAMVAAISVSPKETNPDPSADAFGAGMPLVRRFTIANGGNAVDRYIVSNVVTAAGMIAGITFEGTDGTSVPALVGSTMSPPVAPGGTVDAIVTLATTGVAPGMAFPVALTARAVGAGTVNGAQSDTGTRWAVAAAPPAFTGPAGGNTVPVKSVNGAPAQTVNGGASVSYSVAFRNNGAVAATNAVLLDPLPSGVAVDAAGAQFDGVAASASVVDRVLRVPLGSIMPGSTHVVTFTATVDAATPLGTSLLNIAQLQSDGIAPASSTPAALLVGRSDIVFDALLGATHPVAGASVMLADPVTLQPLVLSVPASATINPTNGNPYVTSPDGRYGFALVVPARGSNATFDIIVRAAGYVDRTIAATLVADATGTLYTVTLDARDGQPLASPGTFTLRPGPVSVPNVYGVLANIPLLSAKPLAVRKTADRIVAEAGDRVAYTVTFSSAAAVELGTTTISDVPGPGLAYAKGTGVLDGTRVEPLTRGRSLLWSLERLGPAQTHTLTYACVVLPDAPDGAQIDNAVAVQALMPASAFVASNGSSHVAIFVRGGVFSDRSVITGRVTAAATGIAGVRLYLENGVGVTTDAAGRFSFRAVRPGMHVVRLDETTLPRGLRMRPGAIDDPRSSVRLVHGIVDEDLMHDLQFVAENAR